MTIRMIAFVLVGSPLCHNPTFLAVLKGYPTAIDAGEGCDTAEATFDDIMLEELKESGNVEPFNVFSVLIQRSSGSTASARTIGLQLMFLSLAALFVSAVSTMQVILQLVGGPLKFGRKSSIPTVQTT